MDPVVKARSASDLGEDPRIERQVRVDEIEADQVSEARSEWTDSMIRASR
jgi:hypothetical protein